MSAATLEKIRKEAESLSSEEKLSLAEHLWAAVPEDHEIEKAWLAEAQRRSKEIDEGKAVLIPWEEVQAKMKDHLENNRRNR